MSTKNTNIVAQHASFWNKIQTPIEPASQLNKKG